MKVQDITIYWNMCKKVEDNFDTNNCWSGNIIKLENGYFEGMVKSSKKDEQDVKHFVFGIINEREKKVYKMDDSRSTVHIYCFDGDYFTSVYLDGPFIKSSYGKYKLEIRDNEYIKADNLIEEIEKFKECYSNRKDEEFYKNTSNDIKRYSLASME